MAVEFISVEKNFVLVISRPFNVTDIIISTMSGIHSVRLRSTEELDELIQALDRKIEEGKERQKIYEEIRAQRKAIGRPRNVNKVNTKKLSETQESENKS